MDKFGDKISIRQFFIIYVIGVAALIIRVLPRYSSFFAKEGTWIASIAAVLPMFLLMFLLYKIMRNGKDSSLVDSFKRILGKAGSKVLLAIYLIACIVFLAFRIRYFAEKCMSSIFTNVQVEFFIISVLVVVYLIAKNKLQAFARFTEFIWIPLLMFVIFILFISIPDIKLENLYPITIYDIDNIAMGVLPIMAVYVYLPCMLFLGDSVNNKEKFLKTGIKYILIIGILGAIISLTTVGVFGSDLSQDLTQPYFTALKNIELFGTIERIEALAITFWIVTDIVLIIILTYVVSTLFKKLFDLPNNRKDFVVPILFLEYIISIYLASNVFELEYYSRGIGAVIYIIFGVGIPIVIYLIGKVRKVIA